MALLIRGKTDWRYILVVVILAAAFGGGILVYQQMLKKELVKAPAGGVELPEIIVFTPKAGDEIGSPFKIQGKARGFWFFEAVFSVKLLDEEGKKLAVSYVQTTDDWMTEKFVPFSGEISFISKREGLGTLVFSKANPSGLPELDKEFRVPVRLKSTETIKVKAYFNNSKLDPEFSCNKVFPVEREIPKTQALGRAALMELLKGPSDKEKPGGFFTSINPGVEIQSLTIEEGIAKVDFSEQLEFQVGGSCRVAAILAQITQTLKQFPTVQNVIISIDGRTEDILQP